METNKYWILRVILAVICGIALCTINSCADKEEVEDYIELAGLKGLYVMVDCDSNSIAQENNLMREAAFHELIVRKLKKHNIKVYTKEEMYNDDRNPCIYLDVQAECYISDYWVYHVSLQLLETVILRKEPPEELPMASTWRNSYLGMAPDSNTCADLTLQCMEELFDEFLKYYTVANPNEPEKRGYTLDDLLEMTEPNEE